MQLPHHLLHPSQILRWDGFFQFPDDIHGLAAGMADIGGFAQEGIGRGAQGVLLELADEQLRTPLSKITSTGEIEQRFRLN